MEELLRTVANSCLNIPYIWGGNHPLDGMDCSGFVLWVYKSIGLWRGGDTTAQGIYDYFKIRGKILDMEAKFPMGSLLFFGKTKSSITHIGIAYNSEIMWEAGGGGSRCKTPADAKRAGACVRLGQINRRTDFVAVIFPQ